MDLVQVFDTETTGFIDEYKPDDHPSQPHLVQLGTGLYAPDGREVAYASLIVKPDGWTIPKSASDIHGITTEMAHAFGIPLVLVVAVFLNMRHQASEMVAHNKPFDDKVMAAQIARLKSKPSKPAPLLSTCTKTAATFLLNLPPTAKMIRAGFNKPKPPTLGECYKFFFGEDLVGAHDAMIDARACARVYFEIKRLERVKAAAQAAALTMSDDPVEVQERIIESLGSPT